MGYRVEDTKTAIEDQDNRHGRFALVRAGTRRDRMDKVIYGTYFVVRCRKETVLA